MWVLSILLAFILYNYALHAVHDEIIQLYYVLVTEPLKLAMLFNTCIQSACSPKGKTIKTD